MTLRFTNYIYLSLFRLPIATVAAVLCVHTASAQLMLELGDPVTLLPVSNFEFQANEVRAIGVVVNNIGPTERVSGYSLELGIGDGGPALGGTAGPVFTAADLVTGSPFASNHGNPILSGGPNPFPGLGSVPQYLGLSLTTTSAAVPPETLGAVDLLAGRSLLAVLTVRAAGFTTPQVWNIQFVGAGSSTFFNDANNHPLTPSFQNSTISVVPEPQEYALAASLGLVGLALWPRRFAFRW